MLPLALKSYNVLILQVEKEGARWCRWSSKLASPNQRNKKRTKT